jgi:membrane-associated phospholipid phosphatase
MANLLREVRRSLGPYEWVTFAYLLFLNTLLLVFRHNLPGAGRFFLAHLGVAAGMGALCWSAERWPGRALRFWRHWYPFLLFIGFFEELHFLSQLVFPRWFDEALISFDYAMFGAHPTVWFEQFASPALNDAMAFAYMTYYFYTVALVAVLYARGELAAFRQTMLGTAIGYCIGYVIALLWPMEGPYHTLAHVQQVGQLDGYFFTAVMNLVQGVGRVHGAAFPSLHVAGATVAVLAARRFRRWLFWVFLPCYLAMLVSTVYGRYHYVADIFGGLAVGMMGSAMARRWEKTKEV